MAGLSLLIAFREVFDLIQQCELAYSAVECEWLSVKGKIHFLLATRDTLVFTPLFLPCQGVQLGLTEL